MFAGFCASFLTSVTVHIVTFEDACYSWNYLPNNSSPEFVKAVLCCIWIVLLAGILGKLLVIYTNLNLLQAAIMVIPKNFKDYFIKNYLFIYHHITNCWFKSIGSRPPWNWKAILVLARNRCCRNAHLSRCHGSFWSNRLLHFFKCPLSRVYLHSPGYPDLRLCLAFH